MKVIGKGREIGGQWNKYGWRRLKLGKKTRRSLKQ
jgi:hypothetical protein